MHNIKNIAGFLGEVVFWIIAVVGLILCLLKGLERETDYRAALYESRCEDSAPFEHTDYCNGYYSKNALAASYGEVQ